MSDAFAEIVKQERRKPDSVLSQPCGQTRHSNTWVTLQIHIDAMSEGDVEKLNEALGLLSQIGVSCDTGVGCGNYDLELDWSLTGAHLLIRDMHCMNCRMVLDDRCNKQAIVWEKRNGMDYPFCSEECKEERKCKEKKEASE